MRPFCSALLCMPAVEIWQSWVMKWQISISHLKCPKNHRSGKRPKMSKPFQVEQASGTKPKIQNLSGNSKSLLLCQSSSRKKLYYNSIYLGSIHSFLSWKCNEFPSWALGTRFHLYEFSPLLSLWALSAGIFGDIGWQVWCHCHCEGWWAEARGDRYSFGLFD